MQSPQAILWDMDGTLVDTEAYWIHAENELVSEYGGTWSDEEGYNLIGNNLSVTAGVMQEHGVTMSIDDIITRLSTQVAQQCRVLMPWRPGAIELLTECISRGWPNALVTMSYPILVDVVVEQCPPDAFTAIITGTDVERGKPDPEPYLLAAQRLSVDIEHCVAIEDSPGGSRSALDAGARVIAVHHLVDVPAEPGLSRLNTLAGVDTTLLQEVASGHVIDQIS